MKNSLFLLTSKRWEENLNLVTVTFNNCINNFVSNIFLPLCHLFCLKVKGSCYSNNYKYFLKRNAIFRYKFEKRVVNENSLISKFANLRFFFFWNWYGSHRPSFWEWFYKCTQANEKYPVAHMDRIASSTNLVEAKTKHMCYRDFFLSFIEI